MRGTRCRRFTLWDAMVLIAAIALALVPMRIEELWLDTSKLKDPALVSANFLNHLRFLLFFVSPAFAGLSVALLILRLRRPRPVLRRLTCQPGMVACTATAVVLGIRLVNLLSVAGVLALDMTGDPSWGAALEEAILDEIQPIPSEIGYAVAAAWTVQVIGGRWRAESGWIDRTGRILGAYWIVTTPFVWFA